MQNKWRFVIFSVVVTVLIASGLFYQKSSLVVNGAAQDYDPVIEPSDFVSKVDNKYFTLRPGTKFSYEKKTKGGLERIEIVVTHETKKIMGIQTTVVWDRVWLNNILLEDTRDWYAQNEDGTVWYFGEAVDNYQNGVLVNHDGSWEAGIDGAKPGIIMQANPKVGDSYRQEYYQGIAEDMADVIALDKKVTVPLGTFNNCLQTRDWSVLDRKANEYKYYCPEVGFTVLEETVKGVQEKVELVNVSTK